MPRDMRLPLLTTGEREPVTAVAVSAARLAWRKLAPRELRELLDAVVVQSAADA